MSLTPLIQKVITQYLRDKGDFPSSEVIVRALEKTYPEAVEKFFNSHRSTLLSGVVTRALAAERNSLRKSSLTRRLLDGTTDGVFDLERFWATPFFVQGEGWKVLGELTGEDHEAIADKYVRNSQALSKRAILHQELAARVGTKKTRDAVNSQYLIKEITRAYEEEL